MPGGDRKLYENEVARALLALREALVRHDENMKAWKLLDECCPYFLRDHDAVLGAHAAQREMVLHAIDDAAYDAYYGANPHERPFEEQYGVSVEDAHLAIPRVGFLRERLALNNVEKVLDLSCNDGWMAANLSLAGIRCDGYDLNHDAVERAKARKKHYPGMGSFKRVDFRKAGWAKHPAVVLFETIEHLGDPAEGLDNAARRVQPGGFLYVSTPLEAVERGDIPNWDHIERKGHLWSFMEWEFMGLLETVGQVRKFTTGPDRVMVAEVMVR